MDFQKTAMQLEWPKNLISIILWELRDNADNRQAKALDWALSLCDDNRGTPVTDRWLLEQRYEHGRTLASITTETGLAPGVANNRMTDAIAFMRTEPIANLIRAGIDQAPDRRVDLYAYGLDKNIIRTLSKAGIADIDTLIRVTPSQMAKIRGLGTKRINMINDTLALHGLSLPDETPDWMLDEWEALLLRDANVSFLWPWKLTQAHKNLFDKQMAKASSLARRIAVLKYKYHMPVQHMPEVLAAEGFEDAALGKVRSELTTLKLLFNNDRFKRNFAAAL